MGRARRNAPGSLPAKMRRPQGLEPEPSESRATSSVTARHYPKSALVVGGARVRPLVVARHLCLVPVQ